MILNWDQQWWGDCQACFIISRCDPHDSVFRSGPCPACGKEGYGLPWPPFWAANPLRRIEQLDLTEYDDIAIAVVLAGIAMEISLEWLLVGIFGKHKFSPHFVEKLLADYQGPEQRLSLLNALAGVRVKSAAKTVGCPDFPEAWKRLRELRNAFVHQGEIDAAKEECLDVLERVIAAGPAVLAEVNNRTGDDRS